jgi:chemotaxis protein MotA
MSIMGAFAPAMGMIGTVIGLVQMLQTMEDPSTIGPAMAVALITTFYGALLANLVFNPMAGKLKTRSKEEILAKEIMLEGILSISKGENPRIIEEKLNSFLPPKQRKETS